MNTERDALDRQLAQDLAEAEARRKQGVRPFTLDEVNMLLRQTAEREARGHGKETL